MVSATSHIELEVLTKFLNISKFQNGLILLYQQNYHTLKYNVSNSITKKLCYAKQLKFHASIRKMYFIISTSQQYLEEASW